MDLPENKKILSRFGDSCKNSFNGLESKSALTLYKDELVDGCLLSYNEKLDEILKHVIVSKRIIEFTGHFEATTPVCLRLCVSVQLPRNCGGCGGEAFYIGTNGNFSSEKLREVADTFIEEYSKNLEDFNVDFLLNHIYYTRVNSPAELTACIFELERFLTHKNIRLIVVDSISYCLRQIDVSARFRIINGIIQMLRHLADKYNLSIIITNFCTTRINKDEVFTVASFGDSFFHLVNSRIGFMRKGTAFYGKLTKNVMHPELETIFML